MVKTQKRFRRTICQLTVAAVTAVSFGAVVVAAPVLVPRTVLASAHVDQVQLQPLAQGPALQLANAGTGASEDCVRVTHITGPDGKDYPTRGIVCSGD